MTTVEEEEKKREKIDSVIKVICLYHGIEEIKVSGRPTIENLNNIR